MLLVNGDLPREMPFTEKSSRNTFIIGAVHLLSITYKMCQIMCFYINTHLLSTEPFSFCDMVPPLLYTEGASMHLYQKRTEVFSIPKHSITSEASVLLKIEIRNSVLLEIAGNTHSPFCPYLADYSASVPPASISDFIFGKN